MTKRRAPNRINEEYVCIDSFIQHLKEIDSGQVITYCEEPEDPPDFWVTIAGVTYAVEVTSIVADYDYDASCNKLIKDIRLEYGTNNIIKGKYALTIRRRPDIPRRRTTQWRTLVSTAATKIREMSNAPCGVESRLFEDANGYMVIQKMSAQGSTIRLCGTTAKWEGEVQGELPQLFKKAIEKKREGFKKKREQLEKKGVLDWDPTIILVFYDAYGYGYIEDAKQAFLKVQDYEWLHSIFLAVSSSNMPNALYPDTPGRRGVFLYSKNKQWR